MANILRTGSLKVSRTRTVIIGFTLIEVLIVTAVVAVIASILFSVFSTARERGGRITCQSNLRQIAMAMQQYVDDNGGDYPLELSRVGPWQQAIFPYINSPHVFFCPDHDAGVWEPINSNSMTIAPQSVDYMFNLGRRTTFSPPFPTSHALRGTHESSLATPATIWMNTDQAWITSDGVYYHARWVQQSSCSGSFVGGIMHARRWRIVLPIARNLISLDLSKLYMSLSAEKGDFFFREWGLSASTKIPACSSSPCSATEQTITVCIKIYAADIVWQGPF